MPESEWLALALVAAGRLARQFDLLARLPDRGLLRAGCFADVVVFDFQTLADGSTIEQPLAYCGGVEHVFVNGTAVVSDGDHTGARPGRTLRRH